MAAELILRGCNPEDGCGERNVAFIYGLIYDSVQISWDIAELYCLFTGDPVACAIADYLLPIWLDMDIADLDYNLLSAGGSPQDGFVPSSSQTYPSPSAVQYPISHADSHLGATKSDLTRNALEQALLQQFHVQTQGSCTFSTWPTSFSVSGVGGSGSFTTNTGTGCQWSAVSQSPWITVTSGASGISSGTVGFTIGANPQNVPRTGSIRVGNGTSSASFSVSEGGACYYSLNPNFIGFAPGGGTATVYVGTSAGCVWSVSPNAAWLTITAGGSGTGPGSFSLNASPGTNTSSFGGTVTVMDQTLLVVVGSSVGTPGTGSATIYGAVGCLPKIVMVNARR